MRPSLKRKRRQLTFAYAFFVRQSTMHIGCVADPDGCTTWFAGRFGRARLLPSRSDADPARIQVDSDGFCLARLSPRQPNAGIHEGHEEHEEMRVLRKRKAILASLCAGLWCRISMARFSRFVVLGALRGSILRWGSDLSFISFFSFFGFFSFIGFFAFSAEGGVEKRINE